MANTELLDLTISEMPVSKQKNPNQDFIVYSTVICVLLMQLMHELMRLPVRFGDWFKRRSPRYLGDKCTRLT